PLPPMPTDGSSAPAPSGEPSAPAPDPAPAPGATAFSDRQSTTRAASTAVSARGLIGALEQLVGRLGADSSENGDSLDKAPALSATADASPTTVASDAPANLGRAEVTPPA